MMRNKGNIRGVEKWLKVKYWNGRIGERWA